MALTFRHAVEFSKSGHPSHPSLFGRGRRSRLQSLQPPGRPGHSRPLRGPPPRTEPATTRSARSFPATPDSRTPTQTEQPLRLASHSHGRYGGDERTRDDSTQAVTHHVKTLDGERDLLASPVPSWSWPVAGRAVRDQADSRIRSVAAAGATWTRPNPAPPSVSSRSTVSNRHPTASADSRAVHALAERPLGLREHLRARAKS